MFVFSSSHQPLTLTSAFAGASFWERGFSPKTSRQGVFSQHDFAQERRLYPHSRPFPLSLFSNKLYCFRFSTFCVLYGEDRTRRVVEYVVADTT